MSITLTLILSMAAALVGGIAKKYYSGVNKRGIAGSFVFNAVCTFASAAVLLCWGGFGRAARFTVLLGILFGFITALQGIAQILALQCGPMSYTMLLISFSTLIPALSGVMFFGESLGWAQIVGIALMLISFALAAEHTSEERRATLRWLVLCLIAFAATGSIGVLQKVHQNSMYKAEQSAFLIIAFVAASCFCAVSALLTMRRQRGAHDDSPSATGRGEWLAIAAVMAVSGAAAAVNNKFNLYLSGVMDSAVFFPIVNGGGLVLSTLAALLIFGERLSKKQWVGVAAGIFSVVMLCDPFS